MPSRSVGWALSAGGYAFLVGAAVVLLLSPVSSLAADILPVPDGIGTYLLAGPGIAIGAAVWWGLVEHRERYSYPAGVAFGLVTGLATVLSWVLVIATTWSALAVRAGWVVIAFVLVVALLVGAIAGIPLLYARRRFDDRPRSRDHPLGDDVDETR